MRSSPEPIPTYPEPSHHLHESIRKDHAVLQPIKPRSRGSGRVRGGHTRATGLINKKCERTVHGKPTAGDANPNIPVDGQGLGNILRQTLQDLKILSGEIAISQGTNIREGLVEGIVVGEGGQQEEIEHGSCEEQHGTVDVGRLRESCCGREILYVKAC